MNDRLLTNYFEGKTMEEELKLVIAWLEESEANMKHYHTLCRLYETTLWLSAEQPKLIIPVKHPFLWKRMGLEILKIAAVIFITVFFTKEIVKSSISKEATCMQTVHAPAGQNAQVILADGSKVWLNAGSYLEFPTQFDQNLREVKHHGEGIFKVMANAEKPFIVATEHYKVRALGTSFNVHAYPGAKHFKTDLLTGKVQISNVKNPNKIINLAPNECVTQIDNKLIRSNIENLDYFSWREGILCFDDPLLNVFQKLELYFDVQIEVTKNANFPINDLCVGKFRTRDGLDHILRVLQLSHQYQYKIDSENNRIIIY